MQTQDRMIPGLGPIRLTPGMANAWRNSLMDGIRASAGHTESIIKHYGQRRKNPEQSAREMYESTADLIGRATIVLWKKELFASAGRNCEIFDGQTIDRNDLVSNIELWVPDVDWEIDPEIKRALCLERQFGLQAILLAGVPPFTAACIIMGITQDEQWIADLLRQFPAGVPVEYMAEHAESFMFHLYMAPLWESSTKIMLSQVVAMLKFRSSTVAQIEKIGPPRAERRRLVRHGGVAPDVRVITLRRSVHNAGKSEGQLIEWSWQWIVRGHWRNQFFPSTGKHEPTFIRPYVKGPEDKPLKPITDPIYLVNR